VHADAGFRGVHKRPDAKGKAKRHAAMRPNAQKALDKTHPT
jgi:hypothetical protein